MCGAGSRAGAADIFVTALLAVSEGTPGLGRPRAGRQAQRGRGDPAAAEYAAHPVTGDIGGYLEARWRSKHLGPTASGGVEE